MLLAKLKEGVMESKSVIMEKSSKRAVIKKKRQKKPITEVKLNLEIQKIMLFHFPHICHGFSLKPNSIHFSSFNTLVADNRQYHPVGNLDSPGASSPFFLYSVQ